MAHLTSLPPKTLEELEMDPKRKVASNDSEHLADADKANGGAANGYTTKESIRKLCADLRQPPSSEFRWLYAGYVLSHIGNHLRGFAFMVIFTHIGGLRLMAANSIFDGLAIALVSNRIGGWLDHINRRRGAITLLTFNAAGVAIVSLLLVVLLTWAPKGLVGGFPLAASTFDKALITSALALIVLAAAVVKCTNMSLNYVYSVDWLIVLAEREIDQTPLADRNAAMNIIDQLIGVVTPLIAGQLMERMDYRHGCLITAACCLVGLFSEGAVLTYLYAHVEELRAKRRHFTIRASIISQLEGKHHSSSSDSRRRLRRRFRAARLFPGVREYFQQACLFAALALALHHISIIGAGGTSMSYAKESGLGADHLGQFSSAGHALGFCAAITYPLWVAALGVKTTGFVGLGMHVFFLVFCVVSIWMPGSLTSLSFTSSPAGNGSHSLSTGHHSHHHNHDSTAPLLQNSTTNSTFSTATKNHPKTSILVYLSAITLAKFGGTAAHIAVHQLMQESIDETIRGAVFGTQRSLGQLCTMAADLVLLILPEISTFGLLIAGSYVFMLVSFASYCYYYFVVAKRVK